MGLGFFPIVPVLIFRFISIYQWTTAAIEADDLPREPWKIICMMYSVHETECAATHCRTLHPATCRSLCS